MRLLGVTETCDLGSMYLRLLREGHDVRVSVSNPMACGTMAGLVPRSASWRSDLNWVREAGDLGVIVFESVGFGELQDTLRADGFNVIGGSGIGDRLESDRAYAQCLLKAYGFNTAPMARFENVRAALEDLNARPRRCVLKLNASAGETFIGSLEDGRDIAAMLRVQPPKGPFVLMDHIDGIETGVGAFFNGSNFVLPACLDWEHKHFFPGDLGELTGEMGTVATFENSDKLFEATLNPFSNLLREAGHVGWVNLNLIINEQGLWPLEFTCRFGYPGFAVLEPLQAVAWAELFTLLSRRESRLPTRPGYSVGVVLTTPPFPHTRKELNAPIGLPIMADDVEPEHLHLAEVGLVEGDLVTAGLYGWTAVVTGTGATIREASKAAYRRAAKVRAPNIRYRTDIGDKLAAKQLQQLTDWGWIKSIPPSRIASQMVR